MKTKEYMTPELEVVEIKIESAILTASDGNGSTPVISDEDGDKDEF